MLLLLQLLLLLLLLLILFAIVVSSSYLANLFPFLLVLFQLLLYKRIALPKRTGIALHQSLIEQHWKMTSVFRMEWYHDEIQVVVDVVAKMDDIDVIVNMTLIGMTME